MTSLTQKWSLYFTGRRNSGRLERIQRQRLDEMVAYAIANSPFYRRLYQGIRLPGVRLSDLPPVDKPTLMAHFDEWVTESTISLQSVQRFLEQQTRPGQRYMDRFSVWQTSGTTGVPGIFLHDARAQAIYNDLILLRAYPNWLNLRQLAVLVLRGFRYTLIIATSGPFAGISSWEQVRQRLGRYGKVLSTFSIDTPLPALVTQLNDLQPVVLASYPSALVLLATEQARGSLRIRPELLACTSEFLAPAARTIIEKAFTPARLVELYGASELPYLAASCRHNWLHLNADWAILEPVDERGQPVPPGQPSSSVLLTNLANRIQPILRYDLGDSVTLRPDPCPCGSRLPALRVEGRQDDILTIAPADGAEVRLLPRAIASHLELVPGLRRFQIIQTAVDALLVRLETAQGSDRQQLWESVHKVLSSLLDQHGLGNVSLQLSEELPHPDPVSGKFREVWSALKDRAE